MPSSTRDADGERSAPHSPPVLGIQVQSRVPLTAPPLPPPVPGMQVWSRVPPSSSLPRMQAGSAIPPPSPASPPAGLTGHLGSLEAPQVLDGHLQDVSLLQLGVPRALRAQAGLRPARQRRRSPPRPPPRVSPSPPPLTSFFSASRMSVFSCPRLSLMRARRRFSMMGLEDCKRGGGQRPAAGSLRHRPSRRRPVAAALTFRCSAAVFGLSGVALTLAGVAATGEALLFSIRSAGILRPRRQRPPPRKRRRRRGRSSNSGGSGGGPGAAGRGRARAPGRRCGGGAGRARVPRALGRPYL